MPSTATNRLQGVTTSVAVKPPCITVATSNITLSGLQTISSVTVVEGDRVLVKGQSTASENGIYNASTGSWTRALDFDGALDVVSGTRVLVRSPSSSIAVEYELTTADPIVIGTTSLVFTLRYGANATYDQTESEIAADVTPLNYEFPEGYLLRYLTSFTSDSTDCTTGLQSLLAVLRQTKGTGYLPFGTIRYTSNLALDTDGIVLEGASKYGTKLKKVGNFVGITITGSASLSKFTLDSAGGADTSAGIIVRAQPRVDVRSVVVQNQGSHGLWLQESSLSYFGDIVALTNGGDGVRLDGTVAPITGSSYVNANTFMNIDARGNGANGFNIVYGYCNYCIGITAQNNTGDGVRLDDARANFVSCYAEFNTGDEVVLENNANCRANTIFVLEGAVSDSAPADSNLIIRQNRSGTYDAHTKHFTSMKFIVPVDAYDGNQYDGTMELTHTANRQFTFLCHGFAGSQSVRFINEESGGIDLSTDRLVATESAQTPIMRLTDGVSAPAGEVGFAKIYVDTADGDLKVRFGDGTIKTIVVDT